MPAYPNKTQKKIAYKHAESGFINIEKWEPPFIATKTGFGFIGVVAEDSKTGRLECSECGKWFQQLPTHYSAKHGMTGVQYRKKFGLFSGTALKSKRIRLIQSQVITKLQKEGRMNVGNKRNKNGKSYGFTKKNKYADNRKGKKKAVEGQNRFGACDLQIMTKIINLSKKLGKTPSLIEIKAEYGGSIISIMHNRYGSYINYCRQYLKMTPNFSSLNPRFGTRKKWREHLIKIGKEGIKAGKQITSKQLLPRNESRYVYKWFKNWEDYKKQLLTN